MAKRNPPAPAAAPPSPPKWRRYKIQRYVPITARDESNEKYLFADGWRTVAQADRLTVGERVLLQWHRDNPEQKFRLAEEWPRGSSLRVLRDQGWIQGGKPSYAPEIATRDAEHKQWIPNVLRFATQAEAQAYARVIEVGWASAIETRVVETFDPANYKWDNGKLTKVR